MFSRFGLGINGDNSNDCVWVIYPCVVSGKLIL